MNKPPLLLLIATLGFAGWAVFFVQLGQEGSIVSLGLLAVGLMGYLLFISLGKLRRIR